MKTLKDFMEMNVEADEMHSWEAAASHLLKYLRTYKHPAAGDSSYNQGLIDGQWGLYDYLATYILPAPPKTKEAK